MTTLFLDNFNGTAAAKVTARSPDVGPEWDAGSQAELDGSGFAVTDTDVDNLRADVTLPISGTELVFEATAELTAPSEAGTALLRIGILHEVEEPYDLAAVVLRVAFDDEGAPFFVATADFEDSEAWDGEEYEDAVTLTGDAAALKLVVDLDAKTIAVHIDDNLVHTLSTAAAQSTVERLLAQGSARFYFSGGGTTKVGMMSVEGDGEAPPPPPPPPPQPPPPPPPAPPPGPSGDSVLEKIILRTFVPGSPGSPGNPGRPYQPARWVTEAYQVCQWVFGIPDVGESGELLPGQTPGAPGDVIITAEPPRYLCETRYRTVLLPAVPAIPPSLFVPASPSKTLIDFQIGWNARARSIKPMRGAGRFAFRVPRAVQGAVVGLTLTPGNTSGYGDIRNGFYVSRGSVNLVQDGAIGASLGAHPDAALSLTRSQGQIVYRIGDDVVHTVANTYKPLYLGAALYMGGDTVEDADLMEWGEGGASGVGLPGIGACGEGAYAIVGGRGGIAFGMCGTWAGGEVSGAGLPGTGFCGAGAYAFCGGSGLPGTGYCEALAKPELGAFCSGFGGFGTGYCSGITGKVGTISGAGLPGIGMCADATGWGFVSGRSAGYGRGVCGAYPEGEAYLMTYAGMGLAQQTQPVLLAVLHTGYAAVGVVAVQAISVQHLMTALGVSTTHELQSIIEARLDAVMRLSVGSVNADAAGRYQAWVLNTELNGLTRYSNYGFNSFAKVGGRYFGAKADGLYLLEGEDDDGTPVGTLLDFGRQNFGNSMKKGLPHCYVGIASSGQMVLRVTTDAGETYHYEMRGHSENMTVQRFDLGKGLKSSYYDLALLNKDGSSFDIDSIEFTPIELARRI